MNRNYIKIDINNKNINKNIQEIIKNNNIENWHIIDKSYNIGSPLKLINLKSVTELSNNCLIQDRRPYSYKTISAYKSCYLKYIANIVDGCNELCSYCYSKPDYNITIYVDFEHVIENQSIKLDNAFPIYFGSTGELFKYPNYLFINFKKIFKVLEKYNLKTFFVSKQPENLYKIITQNIKYIVPFNTKIYVTMNYLFEQRNDSVMKKFCHYISRINQLGIECGLLLKPIIPLLNDSDEILKKIFELCKIEKIPEVCTGFFISKDKSQIAQFGIDYPQEYYDKSYIPTSQLRKQILKRIAKWSSVYKIPYSLCHSFESINTPTLCHCQKEKWI